jgi:hypothetical protein
MPSQKLLNHQASIRLNSAQGKSKLLLKQTAQCHRGLDRNRFGTARTASQIVYSSMMRTGLKFVVAAVTSDFSSGTRFDSTLITPGAQAHHQGLERRRRRAPQYRTGPATVVFGS